MRLIIARLLWSFDLHSQPDNVDPHEHAEFGVWEGVPLRIQLTARTTGGSSQDQQRG